MCRCLVISGTSEKLLRVTPTTTYYARGAFDLKIELRIAAIGLPAGAIVRLLSLGEQNYDHRQAF